MNNVTGGSGGIRTHDTFYSTTAFQAVSIDHSDTLPKCLWSGVPVTIRSFWVGNPVHIHLYQPRKIKLSIELLYAVKERNVYFCAPGESRTPDRDLRRVLLFLLSYERIVTGWPPWDSNPP